MIIGRSPLRISFGGGGTDLPSYYRTHGGFCVSAAITQYVHVTMHRTPLKELLIRYSQIERPARAEDVKHPIIREALMLTGITRAEHRDHQHGRHSRRHGPRLVRQLHDRAAQGAAHPQENLIHPRELAEQACHIEIDLLKEPIGKQDQYIAAFGGADRASSSDPTTHVDGAPARRSTTKRSTTSKTTSCSSSPGYSRAASERPEGAGRQEPHRTTRTMTDNLHFVKELGLPEPGGAGERRPHRVRRADERPLGAQEEALAAACRNPDIDRWYALGHGKRRARRKAHRRRRRRLPDVLHGAEGAPSKGPSRSGPHGGEARLRFRGHEAPLEDPPARPRMGFGGDRGHAVAHCLSTLPSAREVPGVPTRKTSLNSLVYSGPGAPGASAARRGRNRRVEAVGAGTSSGGTSGQGGSVTLGGTGGANGGTGAIITPNGGTSGGGKCSDGSWGCKIVDCEAEGLPKTTVTAKVYDPAGRVPLYNVAVYVPNSAVSPIADGAVCETCATPVSGNPVASALTGADGTFVMEDVPVGVECRSSSRSANGVARSR